MRQHNNTKHEGSTMVYNGSEFITNVSGNFRVAVCTGVIEETGSHGWTQHAGYWIAPEEDGQPLYADLEHAWYIQSRVMVRLIRSQAGLMGYRATNLATGETVVMWECPVTGNLFLPGECSFQFPAFVTDSEAERLTRWANGSEKELTTGGLLCRALARPMAEVTVA